MCRMMLEMKNLLAQRVQHPNLQAPDDVSFRVEQVSSKEEFRELERNLSDAENKLCFVSFIESHEREMYFF